MSDPNNPGPAPRMLIRRGSDDVWWNNDGGVNGGPRSSAFVSSNRMALNLTLSALRESDPTWHLVDEFEATNAAPDSLREAVRSAIVGASHLSVEALDRTTEAVLTALLAQVPEEERSLFYPPEALATNPAAHIGPEGREVVLARIRASKAREEFPSQPGAGGEDVRDALDLVLAWAEGRIGSHDPVQLKKAAALVRAAAPSPSPVDRAEGMQRALAMCVGCLEGLPDPEHVAQAVAAARPFIPSRDEAAAGEVKP
jgi:hypothetical protein